MNHLLIFAKLAPEHFRYFSGCPPQNISRWWFWIILDYYTLTGWGLFWYVSMGSPLNINQQHQFDIPTSALFCKKMLSRFTRGGVGTSFGYTWNILYLMGTLSVQTYESKCSLFILPFGRKLWCKTWGQQDTTKPLTKFQLPSSSIQWFYYEYDSRNPSEVRDGQGLSSPWQGLNSWRSSWVHHMKKNPWNILERFMHFDDAQPIMDSLTKMLGLVPLQLAGKMEVLMVTSSK